MDNINEIINIDISSKEGLLCEYNEHEISPELVEYVIKKAIYIDIRKKITIVINNKSNISRDIKKMIVSKLEKEYEISMKQHRIYDLEQLLFFVLGTLMLLFSRMITHTQILKDILVIVAWVPIWKMVELELFEDRQGLNRRRVIKRLLKSEYVIK